MLTGADGPGYPFAHAPCAPSAASIAAASPPSSSARRLLLPIDMLASVVAIRRGTLPHAGPLRGRGGSHRAMRADNKRPIALVSGRPTAPTPASDDRAPI